MTYEGVPVVVYSNGGDQVFISVGLDAEGSDWSDPQLVHEPTNVDLLDAARTATGIAIVLAHRDDYAVHYFRADIAGSAAAIHQGVELMPPEPDQTRSVRVDLAGGAPYVVAARGLDHMLWYTFAQAADGTAWSPTTTLGLAGSAHEVDVITAYGTPWVVYHDGGDQTVRSGKAAGPGSVTWTNQAHVAEGVPKAEYLTMIRAGIHPAVMYVDSNEKQLMYGIYY